MNAHACTRENLCLHAFSESTISRLSDEYVCMPCHANLYFHIGYMCIDFDFCTLSACMISPLSYTFTLDISASTSALSTRAWFHHCRFDFWWKFSRRFWGGGTCGREEGEGSWNETTSQKQAKSYEKNLSSMELGISRTRVCDKTMMKWRSEI